MITILTGAPGHGKSYTSVKLIDEFVHEGKFVVTNVPLRNDFAEQMAKHHTLFSRFRKEAVKRRAEKIAERVHVSMDLDDIMRVRFEGRGEERGEVVIDEAHNEMNVRGSTRGKSEEAAKRKKVVKYASIHRHFGANITLITQALTNIDLQIRNLGEFHSEVRNFRRLPIIGWLARLLPGGQLFLRVTVWNDKARTKAGVTVYGLNKRLASLYDTHALSPSDEPDNVIMLPSKPHERLPITDISDTTDDTPEWRSYVGAAGSSNPRV
jgi:hypothetical protein